MKRGIKIELNKIYNVDFEDGIKELQDESVDLSFVESGNEIIKRLDSYNEIEQTKQTKQTEQFEKIENLDNLSIAKMKEALNTINKNIY